MNQKPTRQELYGTINKHYLVSIAHEKLQVLFQNIADNSVVMNR